MTPLMCHKLRRAHPYRWLFAIALTAILLSRAAVGHAWSPAPGTPVVNQAVGQGVDDNGNPLSATSNTVTAILSGAPRLHLRKSADADPVISGALFNYTIGYENSGNAPATGVRVVDTLPPGAVFKSASPAGLYTAANHTVTWDLGELAAGRGGFLTLTVQAGTGLPSGTALVNGASLTSLEGITASSTVTTTIGSGANLLLEKSGAPGTVSPDGLITYSLSYRNIGNRAATLVRITDALPAGTAYVPASATASGSLQNEVLTWDIGTVPAGTQGEVGFQVRVSPLAAIGQQINNTAAITGAEQTKVSNTVTTAVSSRSLLLLKLDTPDPVYAGRNITYTLQVENSGTVPLTGIVLRDPLPSGTNFVAADGGGSTSAGERQVEWQIGTLAAGQKKMVTLTLQAGSELAAGQVIVNSAIATSNETTPQTVSAVTTVRARTPGVVGLFDAAWQPAYAYMSGDTVYLQVADGDQNVDPLVAETVLVVLEDLQTGDSETLMLTETGSNTGIFRSDGEPTTIELSAVGDGKLTVAANSRIQATYTDPFDASPVVTASGLIDPLGIVFDSLTGAPVAGVVVMLRNWNNLTDACDYSSLPLLPPGQINPAPPTGADGKFAFPLLLAGDYCYQVTPVSGYLFPSALADADLPAGYTVANGSRGDKFTLSIGDPPLVRDIPVDPPAGRLSLTKSANKTAAAIGDLIAYRLQLTNADLLPVKTITVTDIMPHGLQILPGSSRLDGQPLADPRRQGERTFVWSVADLAPGKSEEITYRAVVGADSPRGDGVNTAFAAGTGFGRPVASNTATQKVKITAGVFTGNGTIIGKVFHDRDGNLVQDRLPTPGAQKPEEPGIAGIAIYLEDGTRVITDGSGKFSILGITPGSHVLRVDETTLPQGMLLVPLSNRFMGDGASQFVDMPPGGILQADFAGKNPDREKEAEPAAPAAAGLLPDGAVSALPLITGAIGGGPLAPLPDEAAGAETDKVVKSAPESGGGEMVPAAGDNKSGRRDWEEEIKTMQPDLDFLSPTDGSVLIRERTRVVLKTPLGTMPTLLLNGKAVEAKQIGRKIDYELGRVTVVEYIDIHLNGGEANLLKAEARDIFGIVRGEKAITVTTAGATERIVIRTDKGEVPADGVSLLRVEISARDRNNRPVPWAGHATVSVSAGEIVENDADPNLEEFQVVLHDGVGRFTLRAPRETGEAEIFAEVDGRRETARVFFSPHLRKLFLVGTGEVVFGHGKGQGDYSFLKENGRFDDGYYTGGRGAFFLKGKVYDDLLLIAAYDTEKTKGDELFRANETNLDSEDKYPIYGDESKTGYEAVSAGKLYLKLEKNRSFLLYGDYKTDLNETRLAAYNRSFNGVKYELNTGSLKVRAFGSYTDQTQVMDILPGRGISGYYHLSKRGLLEGSERVVIETRDRHRPDRVLSREQQARGPDYEIDYDLGAILFKGPVPSHGSDYNPVYVVVSYESKADGEKYYIYGGRGAFKPLPWLEVGATGTLEEKAIGDSQLAGTDLTLTLPGRTVVKAEYAQTKSVFDESGVFARRSGGAWLLSLESEPLDRLGLSGYYRTLDDSFQNLSAVDATRGSTKYGLDAAYELWPATRISGRFFDERDDLNDMHHRLASLGLLTEFNQTKITGEIANESANDNYIPLTNPDHRSPFDVSEETPDELTSAKVGIEAELWPDLSLLLTLKQNLSRENYQLGQAGLNYRLDHRNRLYLREEYQRYQARNETRTLFGVETQLIKNTVAFNEYRLADGADGARNQNVIGLRNKFFLGRGVSGNATGEYLKTVSGAQRSAEPDSVAGSLGLEYLAGEALKLTGRFEHRRELIDQGRDSYLGEVGLACKLHPDYSLLLRERYFTEDAGTGGKHTTSRMLVGVAYRPLLTNDFNALGKMEFKRESNDSATPALQEEAWIFSGEGVRRLLPTLQLTGKYAAKLARDGEFSSYTDLIAARLLYDLTDRWDLGAEYRLLNNHKVNTLYQGGAFEVGYRVVKNLWASAGYSFDRFDADLTGDGYQGEGIYLKIRVKFDENTLTALPQSP